MQTRDGTAAAAHRTATSLTTSCWTVAVVPPRLHVFDLKTGQAIR
jgi:hypothetical protein